MSNFAVSVMKYHDPKPLMQKKIVACGSKEDAWKSREGAATGNRSRKLAAHTEPHDSRERELYVGQA